MRVNHIIVLLKNSIDLCTIKHSIMIKKHFCSYCLQSFSTAEILERHPNDFFKINSKQLIKKSKKEKLLNLNIMRGEKNHLL